MMAANGVCVEQEFANSHIRTVLVSWENELEAATKVSEIWPLSSGDQFFYSFTVSIVFYLLSDVVLWR